MTSDTDPHQGDLLARARQGELPAFEELYRRHVGRVHGLCLRLTGERGLAEDLTQTAFLRAWQRIGDLREDAGFGAWLHRLTTNTVYQDRRSWQRKWARLEGEDRIDQRAPAAEESAEPIDLERAVAALPRGARDVLVLHDVEGYRHDEIAELTGTTVGTSKSQLHRARRLLREALSFMSCPDLDRLIQERLDGTLPDAESRLLDLHLNDCAACRAEEAELRELSSALGRLQTDAEPARDLWPGLRARLEADSAVPTAPARRDLPWLRLAAAGLLLALLLGAPSLLQAPAEEDSQDLAEEHAAVLADYERASAALIRSLEAKRDDMSPATLDTIDSNLALIEGALKRTREALQSSPSDSDLIQLQYALLGRKTSVLQDLVQLPSDRSTRTDENR